MVEILHTLQFQALNYLKVLLYAARELWRIKLPFENVQLIINLPLCILSHYNLEAKKVKPIHLSFFAIIEF